MNASAGRGATWERLGRALIARRVTIDINYRNRGAFCAATGLKYRLVYDIEEARRTNFGIATLTSVEVAYRLRLGGISRFLSKETDELETVEQAPRGRLTSVPDLEPPEPDADAGLSARARQVLREVQAAQRAWEAAGGQGAAPSESIFPPGGERGLWMIRRLTQAERLEVIAEFRAHVMERGQGNETSTG